MREHFLKYCKHPEYLTAGNSDPLADDSNSPWNTYRQDEILRAEILQDVQRLPDEPFYHQPHIQVLITDILFVYCKLNPDVGGYRQGMHELLAPIVYVVEQDAINPADDCSITSSDLRMVEMLDTSFIEHDSFALFSKVMDCAKVFYETGEPSDNTGNTAFGIQPTKSSIVEKSQYIHEVCLYNVDPELSTHLKNIEVLPQVFLIRWIRLLFSREFPFDQMLVVWDTLFSVDPTFKLIDLICTAMLLRIRWDLLEADYSVALQLLLKYPVPQAPNGPHTFIEDAIYLRDHRDTAGGVELITKYTGRTPSPPNTERPTPPPRAAPSLRQKLARARPPLSPPRLRPPSASVEALFQGAAKNVLEQGERLGINQAVRDAMIEIRRNVQEAKTTVKTSGRDLFSETRPSSSSVVRAVAAMDRRNRQLASMLEEPLTALRSGLGIAPDADTSTDADVDVDVDRKKARETLDAVVAKLQFIKIYLEDSTLVLALPDDEDAPDGPASSTTTSPRPAERRVDSEPLSNAVAAMALNTPMVLDSPDVSGTPNPTTSPPPNKKDSPSKPDPGSVEEEKEKEEKMKIDADPLGVAASSTVQTLQRPQLPIPTRSTLAQSSFAWMLEPDVSSPSSSSHDPKSKSKSKSASSGSVFGSSTTTGTTGTTSPASAAHRKRASANANRERTAFLFGEVPSDAHGNAIREEDIFGLEPIRRGEG